MESIFQIDQSLPIPIYQQMVDSIRAAVKKGILTNGQRLSTVQELSQKLGLARGTVTRAYDALEREGLVEKVQGRGTFVRCAPEGERSRKDRAMASIDILLDELDAMGFSAAEINIFLNLKLRERAEQEAKVKIAVVECNPENLSQMAKQLRDIPNVEVYSYLLSSLARYPYNMDEDLDIILTTQAHAGELTKLIPVKKRVTPVALRLTTECMVSIIKLDAGDHAGILCQSQRFGELLQNTCWTYAEDASVMDPMLITQEPDIPAYLEGKQILLVSEDLETHCSKGVLGLLEHFPGQIIRCSYELDKGSFLYVQEKAKRILEAKTI